MSLMFLHVLSHVTIHLTNTSFNLAIAGKSLRSPILFNTVQKEDYSCTYSETLANAMDAEDSLYNPNKLTYGMSSVMVTAFSSLHCPHCLYTNVC